MQTLYFLPRINRFLNERGNVISNAAILFDTWKLDAWKKSGECVDYILAKDGNIWELFYMFPNTTPDDEIYEDKSGGSKLERIL